MRPSSLLLAVCLIVLAGCSGGPPPRQSKTYGEGEKAVVDRLTYSVVDSEIQTRLGDDANNARIPRNRFYIVQVAVSNSSNSDLSIPPMTLVDDAGKTYPELVDGSGVTHWLGVVRKVSPGETERGSVVFDAPASHYKLQLTDETSDSDVYVDMPLTFVHEQMSDVPSNAPEPAAPEAVGPNAVPRGAKKK
jgi:hypothetical protein